MFQLFLYIECIQVFRRIFFLKHVLDQTSDGKHMIIILDISEIYFLTLKHFRGQINLFKEYFLILTSHQTIVTHFFCEIFVAFGFKIEFLIFFFPLIKSFN